MANKIERILPCDAGACAEGPPDRPFEWDARKLLSAALLARGALTPARAGVDERRRMCGRCDAMLGGCYANVMQCYARALYI